MRFEYQADDGEVITKEGSMKRPPAIGKKITVGGKVYRRVYSVGRNPKTTTFVQPDARFTSHSLPLHWQDADTGEKFAPDYDEKGRPRFESERQLREALAKANDHGECIRHEGSFGRANLDK